MFVPATYTPISPMHLVSAPPLFFRPFFADWRILELPDPDASFAVTFKSGNLHRLTLMRRVRIPSFHRAFFRDDLIQTIMNYNPVRHTG